MPSPAISSTSLAIFDYPLCSIVSAYSTQIATKIIGDLATRGNLPYQQSGVLDVCAALISQRSQLAVCRFALWSSWHLGATHSIEAEHNSPRCGEHPDIDEALVFVLKHVLSRILQSPASEAITKDTVHAVSIGAVAAVREVSAI